MAPSSTQLCHLRLLFLGLVGLALLQILLCLWLAPIRQSTNTFLLPSANQSRFITVEFTSRRRLGNLLFDYAALQGIAASHNLTAVMPKHFPALEVFDLKVIVVDDVFQQLGMWNRFHERWSSRYDSRVETQLPKPPSHVVLNGFYQSWKYFRHIEEDLRSHFKFKRNTQRQAEDFIHANTPRSSAIKRVGIHVRRGDILTASDIIQKGYSTPDEDYYTKAMDCFKSHHKQVQFIVVTDSLKWAKVHLAGPDVVFSPGYSAAVDLAILALCDHVIMSVGTFGWWGAWLAGGDTIYYDDWPRKGTFIAYQTDLKDLFPPHWIPMH